MARRRLLLLATAIVLTIWLPYIFGWWLTPPGMRYFWLIYNPDDQNVHLMWARQAMEGKVFFHDLFTTEPHPGLFTNLFSLLLGWFCRLTGISLHFGYQIFRTLVAFAFLLTANWFGCFFLRSERSRFLFLLLVGFSSGFGWSLVLFWWLAGQRPPFFFVDVSPELTMPEAISFLSLTVAPLAALGVTLVMASFACLLTAIRTGRFKTFLPLATLFGMLVVNVHTYAAIPMLIAVALWQVLQTIAIGRLNLRELAAILSFAFPTILLLGGQAFLFSLDPAFVQKASTPTLTPSPVILIGSYGFIALGALWGLTIAWEKWRSGEKDWALVFSWTFAILVSIYLPVSFQRKMIEGLHIALCLLATLTLERLMEWGEKKREQVVGVSQKKPTSHTADPATYRNRLTLWGILTVLTLMTPSQVAFLALNGYWLTHNNLIYDTRFNPPYSRMMMPPYYLSRQHLKLFDWIERNAKRGEAILCHPMLGNYLPVLAGKKVFIGHWAETLNFSEKLKFAVAIWRGLVPPEEAEKLFRQHKIRYVLETDFERIAASGSSNLSRYGKVAFKLGNNRIFWLKW